MNASWDQAYSVACRYELFMDDLPVWGFVGPPPEETKDEEHIYIYTHKSFDINYNDNRVPASTLPFSLGALLPVSLQTVMPQEWLAEGQGYKML